jgi:hypothetical protein
LSRRFAGRSGGTLVSHSSCIDKLTYLTNDTCMLTVTCCFPSWLKKIPPDYTVSHPRIL